MTERRVYLSGVKSAEIVDTRTFSVVAIGDSCPRWSDGRHIIVAEDGYRCKCGKRFLLLEVET